MNKEFIEIVLGLWDTYEDDAFIRDKERGIFFNYHKMHNINYHGDYFSVEGPLNISRSVQGRPVLYTAGTSENFMEIATSYTDGVFTHGYDMDDTVERANRIRQKLIAKQRRPEDFIISISQNPIVGNTEKDAIEKYMELMSLSPRNSLPQPQFFGSAEKVAEQIEKWYEAGAMDMLLLRQDHPHGLRDFIDLVVPILKERGIFRTEYEANTLRGNLEIPNPPFRGIN